MKDSLFINELPISTRESILLFQEGILAMVPPKGGKERRSTLTYFESNGQRNYLLPDFTIAGTHRGGINENTIARISKGRDSIGKEDDLEMNFVFLVGLNPFGIYFHRV